MPTRVTPSVVALTRAPVSMARLRSAKSSRRVRAICRRAISSGVWSWALLTTRGASPSGPASMRLGRAELIEVADELAEDELRDRSEIELGAPAAPLHQCHPPERLLRR